MLVKEIQSLDKNGIAVQVEGMDRDQVLDKLKDCEADLEKGEYVNICKNTLEGSNIWHSPSPRLFIALPLNLDSWDDTKPLTHQFRLYFLCDVFIKDKDKRKSLPQSVHFANHPGYTINRQQEFFKTYGDYILRLLRMVKRGFTYSGRDVHTDMLPLDTLEVLSNCDVDTLGGRLTSDTIGPAVDKAIEYLQILSPPKWSELGLSHSQSVAVKSFLDMTDGDNSEGRLNRYIHNSLRDRQWFVYWVCPRHHQQYFEREPMERLCEFVNGHAGHIDMQQGTLCVDLRSKADVEQFVALHTEADFIFSITLKLACKESQLCLKDILQQVAELKTIFLEIDGIIPDAYFQDRAQRIGILVASKIMNPARY
ncbi:hypothetical protein BGZ82_011099 [Podila clonocystis]|nr:hypothetical protein BGZ82_011099 [Podila clonocystis]